MAGALLASGLLLATLATAHPAGARPRVWALDDSYKLNPHTATVYTVGALGDVKERNPAWDGAERRAFVSGARNEVVAFQLVIQAGNKPLENVSVIPDDLRGPGTIPRSLMSLFRVHYTPVEKPSKWPGPSTGRGWYPDALVPFDAPRNGAPFEVPASFSQAVWIDAAIPALARPGRYTGVFRVVADGELPVELPVELTVWAFTMPSERHLRFWSNHGGMERSFGIDLRRPEGRARLDTIERQLWRLVHDHRVDALHRHSMVYPAIREANGRPLVMDWTDFDARYGGALDGSLFSDGQPSGLFLLPPILHEGRRWPKGSDTAFVDAIRATVAHWKAKGWRLDRTFVYLGDEPKSDPAAWEEIRRHARMVKEAAPEVRTTVAFNRFSPAHLTAFTGLLDYWLVDAAHYRTTLLAPRRAAGDWVGFYQQGEPWIGNESLDTDALGFRTWPWIAWKYRVDVVYLYAMTYWVPWRKGFDIWTNPANWSTSNSQGVLVYPGSRVGIEGVVPSIRLKMIRRGMQDYEYLWLAGQRGGDPDRIVNRIIRRALDETTRAEYTAGEWSRDPMDWARARAELARMIVGASGAGN